METKNRTMLTVEANIEADIDKVWNYWTLPEHITHWCAASDDWHAPYADNDVQVGGNFKTTMAAKDGSFSFDFGGVYTEVEKNKRIAYVMGDGRTATIDFSKEGNGVKVVESFEAEHTNPLEMQQGGWQAILNNFKSYTEAH